MIFAGPFCYSCAALSVVHAVLVVEVAVFVVESVGISSGFGWFVDF